MLFVWEVDFWVSPSHQKIKFLECWVPSQSVATWHALGMRLKNHLFFTNSTFNGFIFFYFGFPLENVCMAYCPVLQHLYSPSVWTLCFSACLFRTLLPKRPVRSDLSALSGLSRPCPHQLCLCFCNHGWAGGGVWLYSLDITTLQRSWRLFFEAQFRNTVFVDNVDDSIRSHYQLVDVLYNPQKGKLEISLSPTWDL